MDVSREREKDIELLEMQNRFRLFMNVFPGVVFMKDSRDLSLIFANDYMKPKSCSWGQIPAAGFRQKG